MVSNIDTRRWCSINGDRYVGETARSAYTRGKEHARALDRKEKASVLWRHTQEKHEGSNPDYRMNIVGVFGGDALSRQVSEAVHIRHTLNAINNKEEWNSLTLPSLSVNGNR